MEGNAQSLPKLGKRRSVSLQLTDETHDQHHAPHHHRLRSPALGDVHDDADARGGRHAHPYRSRARAADDDNPRGYYEFEPVKKTAADATWLRDTPGKAVKMIYALLRDLPEGDGHDYRILFMQRPLEESVRSQQVMLERLKREGSSLPPEEMRAVFARELASIRAWLAEERPAFRVLDLDYPAVLADPETEARRVCDFLGVDNLDPVAMAGAVDAGLHRQK